MNFKEYIRQLSESELNELYNEIWNRKKELASMRVSPLSTNERMLVKNGEVIMAVKEYKARNQCSLFDAKVAIDNEKVRN